MKKTKIQFYWHLHHNSLIDFLTEPIENRIKYIKENKPKAEIELRLKLLKPIKGKLPEEYIKAWQKFYEAKQKYDEAKLKYQEAGQKHEEAWKKYYEKVGQTCKPQILALHKKECPNCPWTGKTIFPIRK